MPKGRILAKRISYDERVSKLSLKATLLYTWCIPHLDVRGRLYGDPYVIKGVVVPYILEFTPEIIERCQREFADQGLVDVYGNSRKYMYFTGFAKNQTLNLKREAPSEIPNPNGVFDSQVREAKPDISKYNVIVHYLNKATGKSYKTDNHDTQEIITARIKEGYTIEDFKKVIDNMCAKWSGDEKMEQFLRPSTLFRRSKIEGYLNADKGLSSKVNELRRV